ncbi:OLC1v1030164C1 [Oldenlandia corymbosa var. corymbosa]|uniref:OLC1v1030164C1 n=1 Tax=Oldenlandia corymbosa var. corymbosa TaxID=529605 RepID=A0AAV1CFG3_OLDCO|nr:OLC1v1030164C1 [Oldenlandia corymbosa var. corymbosa]
MNRLSSFPTARRRIGALTTVLRHHSTSATKALFSTKSPLKTTGEPPRQQPPVKAKPQSIQPNLTRRSSYPVPRQSQNPKTPNFDRPLDFNKLRDILVDSEVQPGPDLENALTQSGIVPTPDLLLQMFNHFDCSPKPLYSLFLWAEKQTGYKFSVAVFNGAINALGKAREFGRAWDLIQNKMLGSDKPDMDTFAIMIRRYTRARLPSSAIHAYEFASNLDFLEGSDVEHKLFEILLDSLCKEGRVKVASKCLANRRLQDTNWVPSIRIFNILLNGWFRARNLRGAEQLWMEMKKENIKPTTVTYGTLIEGYCRMGLVDVANDLIAEMRKEGVEPNAIVYNPVIDALGEAGRFQEALALMEQLSVLESGPTLSTYNSLVKGFCKAEDLEGASITLKMMINRGVLPSITTYNYFFKYFSKSGKIEEGLNLYNKILESGYSPDRLTYRLLVKMLCEEGRLDLSMQVVKEMRSRGCDLDLATSTMLIHLQIKKHQLDMAFDAFEDLIRRGLVPQYLTYEVMSSELRKDGKEEIAQKLYDMMSTIPHSKKLPNTFGVRRDLSHARKISIMKRAVGMSNVLKTCNNRQELLKRKKKRRKMR